MDEIHGEIDIRIRGEVVRSGVVARIDTSGTLRIDFTDPVFRDIVKPATTTTTGAIMAKKDNVKVIADQAQRIDAAKLTEARQRAKEWTEWGNIAKDKLRASVEGKTDITFVTKEGAEVASITESEPKISYDMAAYFKDHPEAEAELHAKYAKDPTTTVTVATKWVEP